jgi:hypothetical protein
MGHAESACGQELVDRISRWISEATAPARSCDHQDQGASTSRDPQTPNAAA